MNTLELKQTLLEIIRNTDDKTLLEKIYKSISSVSKKDKALDIQKHLTPELKKQFNDEIQQYKKNPDTAISMDDFIKQIKE